MLSAIPTIGSTFMTSGIRAGLLTLHLILPTLAQAFDLDALAEIIAESDTVEMYFVESRTSGLLQAPLKLNGRMRIVDGSILVMEIHGPFVETRTLSVRRIEIRRPDGFRRSFSLHRAPELAALREALTGLLSGDPLALTENFHTRLSGNVAGWCLVLEPRDPVWAERLTRLTIRGRGGKLASYRVELADGDQIRAQFIEAQ